jgi:16S rRNA A1518/A1519 N6-dimethyltransferase RsmA/KsgA/DIM1 with predicted DNA glycosylase/AP lyase activity
VAGIDPAARGETLSVDDFVRLANHAAASAGFNSSR